MLVLSRQPGTLLWKDLVQRYDFDCVLTENAPEAEAFASDPNWQLVFTYPNSGRKPHEFILLRRRPEFAPLIARCLREPITPLSP
jgi:hypothetical protein